MADESSEYVVVAGTGATFEALRGVVHERGLAMVEEDRLHRRLAFRLGRPEEVGRVKALCAVLDAGKRLSKMVVVCVDEAGGGVVSPDASLQGLFMQVERRLHTGWGRQSRAALPPVVDHTLHGTEAERRARTPRTAITQPWVVVAVSALVFLLVPGAGSPASSASPPPATASHLRAPETAVPSRAGFAAAARFARSREGSISFAVVGTTGRLRGYNVQQVYVSASVVKALYLVGYLRFLHGSSRPLLDADRSLLDSMIRVSDNDAAQTIFSRLGAPNVLAVARLAGMRHFTMSADNWASGQLTADDQVRFFARLPQLLPEEFRSYALGLLCTIVPWESWGVPAASRPYWRTYFKGGWRGTDRGQLVHQVARLEHDDEVVVICVLSDGTPSQAYGIATIEGIARRLLPGTA